tara:strand:- start:1375 stop:1737 length:363 start_codon:yes stop_codon:yes gene_type:complete
MNIEELTEAINRKHDKTLRTNIHLRQELGLHKSLLNQAEHIIKQLRQSVRNLKSYDDIDELENIDVNVYIGEYILPRRIVEFYGEWVLLDKSVRISNIVTKVVNMDRIEKPKQGITIREI